RKAAPRRWKAILTPSSSRRPASDYAFLREKLQSGGAIRRFFVLAILVRGAWPRSRGYPSRRETRPRENARGLLACVQYTRNVAGTWHWRFGARVQDRRSRAGPD